MLKTPKEFAELMLTTFLGNKENALIELYNASRAYPLVPCSFFHEVANIIREA